MSVPQTRTLRRCAVPPQRNRSAMRDLHQWNHQRGRVWLNVLHSEIKLAKIIPGGLYTWFLNDRGKKWKLWWWVPALSSWVSPWGSCLKSKSMFLYGSLCVVCIQHYKQQLSNTGIHVIFYNLKILIISTLAMHLLYLLCHSWLNSFALFMSYLWITLCCGF